MHSERRQCRRYTIQPSGHVPSGSDQEVIIQNICDDGIGILSRSALQCGSEVEVQIRAGADTLKAWGKITWANDVGEAGIHLLEPQQWQEYFQQWRSLIEEPAHAAEPLATPTGFEPTRTLAHPDDERVFNELRTCFGHSLEADLESERVRAVRARYLAAITLAAFLCAGAVWVLIGRLSHFGSANTRPRTISEFSQPILPTQIAVAPQVAFAASPQPARPRSVGAHSSTVLMQLLPGIRYESGPNFARFFIDVSDNFKLHAVALTNPDRIYFDLPQSNARLRRKSIAMNNDFVRRIRVAERSDQLLRVVIDLKCSCTYRFQPWPGSRNGVRVEVRPRKET
jgi:hypothetical protein